MRFMTGLGIAAIAVVLVNVAFVWTALSTNDAVVVSYRSESR